MSEGGGGDDEDKTEDPSARRLEQALEKGQTFSSKEFVTFVMLAASALALGSFLPSAAPGLLHRLGGYLRISGEPLDSRHIASDFIHTLLAAALPMAAAVWAASALAAALQHPLIWTSEPLAPKANRVSIPAGIKRLFSVRSVVEFLKAALKIIAVGGAGVAAVAPYADSLLGMVDSPMDASFALWRTLTVRLLISVCVVAGVIAVLDYGYQRFDYYKSMRMSRHELKEEYKETEGNPEIKAKIAEIRRARARKRMAAAVPKADVVITNPVHYAVALQYDMSKDHAPRVIAKGKDEMALRIREIAEKHGVPVIRNPALARALYDGVAVDTYIPEQFYRAAAEIIRHVFGLKGKMPGADKRR